ncbi:MAG: hypothetical protein C6W55_01680 [Thermobacillus sp.]|uniref:transposase n=1 Tax=Thermobacillus TaxID=76632 RepID=UPI00022C543A|nr:MULTISPECIES: transposase [Thermobacillus]REK59141.1 MAG: hypothetical protein C6W55_01680 [Thermobacillus sp.]
MYHIRQEELFSFEQLMEMEITPKADTVLEQLPIGKILHAIGSHKTRGRPETLNTRAMIYSLIIAKLEHIRFIKDLVRRLKESLEFRTRCRFTGSDRIPSEASYSRLITKLQQADILQKIQEDLVNQAMEEGFVAGDVLAVDSSHIEAFDRNPRLDKKGKSTPKPAQETDTPVLFDESVVMKPEERKPEKPKRNKRGRIPKAEKAEWEARLEAYKASLSLFEREVADMLHAPRHVQGASSGPVATCKYGGQG